MEKVSNSSSSKGRDKGKGAAPSSLSLIPSSSSAAVESKNDAVATARTGGGKLEKMVGWVSSGLHTAFFVSMDKCSCVKLDTLEEPILLHRPLLLSENRNSFSVDSKHLRRSNSSGGIVVTDDDVDVDVGASDLPSASRKRHHKPRSDPSKPAAP